MIFRNKKKAEESISRATNIISGEAVLKGSITASGNICIEGTIFGDVSTEAKVVVARSARIEGYIIAREATVAGEIKGGIEVKGLLILKATGCIQGNIVANELIVEEGALLEGTCLMGLKLKNFQIEKSRENIRLSPIEKRQENIEKNLKESTFQKELRMA